MGYTREIWVSVKGFEMYYEISSSGRVKSVGSHHLCKKGILNTWLDKDGYERVGLSKKGKCVQRSVHRLVAENFIPNPDNKQQVNHKNGMRNDNRVENLEWVTDYENKRHSIEKLGHSKRGTHGKKVRCVETREIYPSEGEAARRNGISQGAISYSITKGVAAGGLHWVFCDNNYKR